MSLSRPIQCTTLHVDLIWPDDTFKASVLLHAESCNCFILQNAFLLFTFPPLLCLLYSTYSSLSLTPFFMGSFYPLPSSFHPKVFLCHFF